MEEKLGDDKEALSKPNEIKRKNESTQENMKEKFGNFFDSLDHELNFTKLYTDVNTQYETTVSNTRGNERVLEFWNLVQSFTTNFKKLLKI